MCTMNIAQISSGYTKPIRMQTIDSQEKASLPEERASDIKESLEMAKTIFQGVHFLLQEDMKLFGANSATLPLQVAYACITAFGNQDDVAECEVVLQEMSSSGYHYLVNFTKGD